MAVFNQNQMDRKFRIYDGSSPRNYVNVFQLTPPSLPLKEPRSESTIVPDGGGPSNFMSSYTNDTVAPFAPIAFSLQLLHMPEYLEMLYACGNPLGRSPWVVGGDTWTGVATNAIGTRVDARGNSWSAVPPDDTTLNSRMISLVANNMVVSGVPAGTPLIVEWKGCVINSVNHEPGDGGMMYFMMEGMCYGGIDTTLTDWPAGNESTPS